MGSNTLCTKAYMIGFGAVFYRPPHRRDSTFMNLDSGDVPVLKDTWTSEIGIWAHWHHRGRLVCHKASRILCLNCHMFHQVVSEFAHHSLYVALRKVAIFTAGHY